MLPDTTNLLIFLAASLTVILTPGPAMMYILSRGLGQGRQAGMVSAGGVVVGAMMHTVFAALGVSAILAASATAFTVMKFVGAAYLIYLGIRHLRGENDLHSPQAKAETVSKGKMFVEGMLANLLNPKLALFFLFFLPQFADPKRGSVMLQILLLGLIYNFFVLVWQGTVGILSGSAGDWIKGHTRFLRWQRRFTGSLLITLGAGLAFARRS